MTGAADVGLLGPTDTPMYPIASVDNALRLVTTLRDRGTISLSEASLLIGCARSTAHRLLAMLKHHGFAAQDPDTRMYLAGDGLLKFDRGPAVTLAAHCARPILRVIAGATNETAHLAELRGGSAFFLESIKSDSATGTGSRKGVAYPAHCVAAGKALLANVPRDLLPRLVGDDPLDTLTPASIRSIAALERHLRVVRERGYAVNVGESQLGIAAVAVAIPPLPAFPPLALIVAGPAERMAPARMEKIAGILERATSLVAERFEGAGIGGVVLRGRTR
jgi:IclR family transcriptional regulator, acetate operon repressor